MSERSIKNAKIESTGLGYVGGCNVPTAYLNLVFPPGGQGFGGYCLKSHAMHDFVMGVLEVVGVDTWEELKGKYIRIDSDWSKIYAIGNIIEDKWYNPSVEFSKVTEGKN
jgi:hypothetical protein